LPSAQNNSFTIENKLAAAIATRGYIMKLLEKFLSKV
jgi:hypothetical protein